jgi:hypothetical protein
MIQDAMRLMELYEFQKKDPQAARRVMETMKERFPDAPEFAGHDDS